jgi:hypothetical protein
MHRSLMSAITAILDRVRARVRDRAHGPGSLAGVRKLDDERRGHFFSWFHLDPLGDPVPTGSGRAWHCFRPAGEAFRAFVELDILVHQSGRILQSCVGLDRVFLDHPRNGVFARDLVKSYLQWGLDELARAQARALIDNIANPAASGVPVLIHARSMPPAPGEDTTGGYLVYLGKRTSAEAIVGNSKLTMTNMPGAFLDRQIFPTMDHRYEDRPDEPRPSSHSSSHASAQRPSWLRLNISPAVTLH